MTRSFPTKERYSHELGYYMSSIYHANFHGDEYFVFEVYDETDCVIFQKRFGVHETEVRLSVLLDNFGSIVSWMEKHHIFLQEDDGEHYLDYLMRKFLQS